MIRLRLVILAVLVAASFAACLTYFVIPLALVDTDQRLPATMPTLTSRIEAIPANIGRHPAEEQQAAFERAAEAILKLLPNVQASARTDELPIIGHIPLPKRRPRDR